VRGGAPYDIFMSKFLKRFLIITAVVLAGCLIAALCLEIARRDLAASLTDQRAAERWGGETAQLSVFFAGGEGYDHSRVFSLERAVDTALTEASLASEDGGRLWYHAYSAETEMYASTTRDGALVRVTAFGGDYFHIHQMKLAHGSYLSPDGATAGYAFLDENAAWRLFGATDVVGMPMTLGGGEYIVCGVGRAPEGTPYDDAYGAEPRVFVLLASPAGQSVTESAVYEIVLPEPVDGFARGIVEKNFTAGDGTVIVENTTRFGAKALFAHLKARPTMGTRTSAVTFPWWENIARVAEYRCADMLLWETICLAAAAVILLSWIGIAWNPAGRAVKRGAVRLRDAAEAKWERMTIRRRPRSRDGN